MRPTFNLVDEPFIPCRTDGGVTWCNLRDTLVRSHELREIDAASPLTAFALYRFLLVIVHRCLDADDWSAGRLPAEKIEKYLETFRDRFDLFDAERPFLQRAVEGKPGLRPVSDLIAELPAATNINHNRHTLDETVSLCPVCCTHGLLRLAPYCGEGGSGKSPSINKPPPAYFLPLGSTLFDTLRLNAAALPVVPGDGPQWEDARSTSERIGPLEAFTWEPRTVQLLPRAADGTTCSLCGRSDGPTVSEIVFLKGRDRSGPRVREWRDPHAAYLEETRGRTVVVRTQVPPETVQHTESAAGFWRQAAAVILRAEGFRCAAVDALGDSIRRVRVVAFHTRKAKVLHDHGGEWIVEVSNDSGRSELLRHLEWLREGLAEIGEDLAARHEFERQAERFFRRRLVCGSAEEFILAVREVAGRLTQPPVDPRRPLDSRRAIGMAKTVASAAFPISEVTP